MIGLLLFCYEHSLSVVTAVFRRCEGCFLDLFSSSCFCLSLYFCVVTCSHGFAKGSCVKLGRLPSGPAVRVGSAAPLLAWDGGRVHLSPGALSSAVPLWQMKELAVRSAAGDAVTSPKKYSKALDKKKLLIVFVVKILKHKTRTGLCLELVCQHGERLGEEETLYFAGTTGCRATS